MRTTGGHILYTLVIELVKNSDKALVKDKNENIFSFKFKYILRQLWHIVPWWKSNCWTFWATFVQEKKYNISGSWKYDEYSTITSSTHIYPISLASLG